MFREEYFPEILFVYKIFFKYMADYHKVHKQSHVVMTKARNSRWELSMTKKLCLDVDAMVDPTLGRFGAG